MAPHEPIVLLRSRDNGIPHGYVFVPKGNIYITRHCRQLAQELDQRVFRVQNTVIKGRTITAGKRHAKLADVFVGISVPQSTYDRVKKSHEETAEARADVVRKKDRALESKVRDELLKRYPLIPEHQMDGLLHRTLKKRSGRVGRSTTLDMDEVVELAVRAHIRHTCTNYDILLKQGTKRDIARERVENQIRAVLRQWRGNERKNVFEKRETRKKSLRSYSNKPELHSRPVKSQKAVEKSSKVARGAVRKEHQKERLCKLKKKQKNKSRHWTGGKIEIVIPFRPMKS